MPTDKRREADIVVDCLRSAVMEGGAGLKDVPGLLRRTIDEELWRERVILRTGEVQRFDRFIDFVIEQPLEGLGADIATLKRLCSGDAAALNAIDRAIQNPSHKHISDVDIINVKRPDGTSATAALRRLRKDRPDLHERVIAGEVSPHAAMVAAGFRVRSLSIPTEPNGAARAIRRHFTADQIDALIEALQHDG